MKISMNLPDEHQHSVMQRILDGSLAVDSPEEFREILEIYPEDAFLYRKYADLLLKRHHLPEAARAFDKTARLFVGQGMNLQAIVAKILQWGIEKPTHEQGQQFQKLLSTKGGQYSPLQRLWASMRYPELVTTMLRLVRIRLAAGEQITCVDDPADEIYFVVSGTLMETISEDCRAEAARAGVEIEPRFIGPNDIFGNVFPLDETTVNTTEVAAVTDVELVKIAKPVLIEACRKHPHIENLLRDIYKTDNVDGCDRPWQTVRRSIRFSVTTRVEIVTPLQGAPDPSATPLCCTGIALDISSGGMCIDLGAAAGHQNRISLKGQSVRSVLDLDGQVLNISGKIVWQRCKTTDKSPNMLIGIRFTPLNPADRKLLIDYCTGKFDGS
jgi:hypothetical protein